MKDFLFLGSDVSLFRHSIELYADYLPTVSDYEYSTQVQYEELQELLNSGFNNHEFRFPLDFAYLVLDALAYYDRVVLNRYRASKGNNCLGYYRVHSQVSSLIAQINLMLDLNDDD